MNRTYGMYDKETQKEYEAVGNTDGTRKRISGFNTCYDRRWRADCPSTKTIPRKVEERNASYKATVLSRQLLQWRTMM